ncbi:MAG TPA: sulfotransferase [Nocardioidaceae bacterium]|nr:sulfotransferase [Nocardioidaceae bacterium]
MAALPNVVVIGAMKCATTGTPVRGETSPGYTSPDHALAPGRMARVLPGARLLYLVRDPVDRAVSQYEHHAREGAERRTLAEAVLDPDSQYVSRGRYLQRLEPFLHRFSGDRVQVVVQERLRDYRRRELRRV